MESRLRKLPGCLYCGSDDHVQLGESVIQCMACGRRMEIAGFTKEQQQISREVEKVRTAVELAKKNLSEQMQRFERTQAQAAFRRGPARKRSTRRCAASSTESASSC